MKKVFPFSNAILISLICLPAVAGRSFAQQAPPHPAPGATRMAAGAGGSADYGKIPLHFIPNKGQVNQAAAFYVHGRDKAIYFTPKGLTIVLAKRTKEQSENPPIVKVNNGVGLGQRWVVRLEFVDANQDVRPVGLEKTGAVISYFKGRSAGWKTGLPAYSKIAYRELWPGIDLVYSGTFNRMKYEFVVHPGADPARIRLAYRGTQGLSMTPEGGLEVITSAGSFRDDVPVACQQVGGNKVDVPVAYSLEGSALRREDREMIPRPSVAGGFAGAAEAGLDGSAITYGFEIGEYDRSRTLVLDPAVLVSCGFIGGSGEDKAHGVAVDSAGNAYIAGETSSMDLGLPVSTGPDLTYNGGDSDAFVAKLNPEGTSLVYCGYIGGSGKDSAADLKVDPEGNVYIAGTTSSPETTFPVVVGPDLTYNGGESDAFVAKLNPEGTSLVYCGYIGGAGKDVAAGIAWEGGNYFAPQNSSVYVTGSTSSTELTFPVAVGPDLTYNGGESDAFVAKVKPDWTGLDICGYIGGAGTDEAAGLALAAVGILGWGDAYVLLIAGSTSSTELTFPVAVGPDLTYNGGESDAFVARVKSDWMGLDFCGYVGGAGLDAATDIAVTTYNEGGGFPIAASMEVVIAGYTSSRESTFPVAVGPDLTYNGGEFDAFVAEVDGFSGALYGCGYIGGSGSDAGTCIVRGGYNIYVAGVTSSTESTFPAAFGTDVTYNGGTSDAFLAKLTLDRTGIASCGYIGGAGADRVEGMAALSDGKDVLVAGTTDSTETTLSVTGGPDLIYNGGTSDAFLARIHTKGPTLTSLSRTSATVGDPGFTLTVTGSDFLKGASVLGFGKSLPTTFVSDTELQAAVATKDLAGPASWGPVHISVENPDHEISAAFDFVVHPGPLVLTSLSPARIRAGSAGFVLTLTGSGFVIVSTDGFVLYGPPVLWNGVAKDSIYVSYTELQVNISDSDIANGGAIQVIVKDPGTNAGDSNALIFPVSSFTMAASPASKTVTAGEIATYSLQVTPQFGSFDFPVSLACSGIPSNCTASFSPASVTPGAVAATTTLTLTTKASSALAAAMVSGRPGEALPAAAWLLVILVAPFGFYFRKFLHGWSLRRWVAAGALACSVILMAGCGSSTGPEAHKGPGTPKGSYTITVQGKSGSLTVSTTVNLEVK